MKVLFIGGSLHGKIQKHSRCDTIAYIDPVPPELRLNEGNRLPNNKLVKEELYTVYGHGEKYSLFVDHAHASFNILIDLLNVFDIAEKEKTYGK